MENAFDTMDQALRQAREVSDVADRAAFKMARMLDGRLRHVNSKYLLGRLKSQLASFNAVTGKWKD